MPADVIENSFYTGREQRVGNNNFTVATLTLVPQVTTIIMTKVFGEYVSVQTNPNCDGEGFV